MKKLRNMVFCGLVFLIFVPIVFSQESYFGITLDCLEGCKDGKVDVDKEVMLKLVIKNNFNYWVSLGGEDKNILSLSLEIENSKLPNNGKEVKWYNDLLRNPYYLKPKSTEELYFTLETYNDMDKNKRLGEWKITPKLDIGWQGAKYYKDPFTGETIPIKSEYQIPRLVSGNILKFEAKQEEVEVQPPKERFKLPTLKQLVSEPPYSYFTWIIGLIIAGIIIYYATQGRRRNRGRR